MKEKYNRLTRAGPSTIGPVLPENSRILYKALQKNKTPSK
jgi:hypothetical protein